MMLDLEMGVSMRKPRDGVGRDAILPYSAHRMCALTSE